MRLTIPAILIAIAAPTALTAAAADMKSSTPAYVTAAINDPARKDAAVDDAHRKIADVMTFAQVKPGQKVVELIPADGYWTKVFSGIVGTQGHVYTIWPDQYQEYVNESYAEWQGLIATPKYSNVSLLRQPAADFKVPDKVDLVFTAQNYHDYHDRFMGPVDMAVFDKKVFDALKPGGVFVVIDNVALAGSGFSATDTIHRVDPEAVKTEVESVGFVFDGSSDALRNSTDTHTLVSYTAPMSGHNDEFIFRFRKPSK
ncbi:MAG: class I SAM-dependent methyltransferase [Gammaproteobacteria bacterium]